MADKEKAPDPIEDVRKGLGLLFRAAKTAVQKIPTDPIEKVVLDGAREVGRAVENVATTIEKKVFGHEKPGEPPPSAGAEQPTPPIDAAPSEPKHDQPESGADVPRGPRVG